MARDPRRPSGRGRSTQPGSRPQDRLAVQIFVDYWNFSLALRSEARKRGLGQPRVDWDHFPERLVQQAASALALDNLWRKQTSVFTSHDPERDSEVGHSEWVDDYLRKRRRTLVSNPPRVPVRSPPSCPKCHVFVAYCPWCGADLRGFEEKGVDTGLSVALATASRSGELDIAILISSDTDMIPAIRSVRRDGHRVVHARFPPGGNRVARACDVSIDILEQTDDLVEH